MSSTDDDRLREEIGALFDDLISPIAERMRAGGMQPFPVRPDASLGSYFAPRAQVSMARDDFTAPSCLDPDDFADRLAAHWEALGRHELRDGVPRIAAVARAAHAAFEADRQDADVSPFIYVMF